ncbi:MAG: dephospho-CoA kinase [Betaproteobacteria bacterium]|nr:dephospho-CoA kinase [Betaproteobacteria bacterium]
MLIGLTGGIGSGKTSAANLFAELGAEIIDTDELAHRFTRPGGLGMAAIRQAFGPEFVTPDGALDRAKMRALVFSDPGAKGRLEAILHPLIREEVERRIAASRAPYALAVVPLLVETDAYRGRIDRLLVVDCAEETQITRTMSRSRLTRDEVRGIMGTQVPRSVRLAAADDVILNDGDLGDLQRQVQALHEKYLGLARRTSAAG